MNGADASSAKVPAPHFPKSITVCVCTYQRPAYLARLLEALSRQRGTSRFMFSVVVVDNDADRSSETVVQDLAIRAHFPLTYDCEPERNISLARNRAIRNATGNLIAFIDDDELVEVTPKSIRLRKSLLDPHARKKEERKREAERV